MIIFKKRKVEPKFFMSSPTKAPECSPFKSIRLLFGALFNIMKNTASIFKPKYN